MNEPLQTTLADAVQFLRAHNVAYALVGGLATSLRGKPRVTADVDMLIAIDVDRALGLLAEVEQSPFVPLFPDAVEVVQTSFILPLRHRETGIKLDLAIGLSGFEQQAVHEAEEIVVGKSEVAVAKTEHLIVMKVLAGRPQDEEDVLGMAMAQASSIDWHACLALARDLGEALGQDLVGRIQEVRDRVQHWRDV